LCIYKKTINKQKMKKKKMLLEKR